MKITLLTTYISPYRAPLFDYLALRFPEFSILVSAEMGADREWKTQNIKSKVIKQKSFVIKQMWKHPHGFQDQIFVYIPIDSLKHLYQLRPDVLISSELGIRSIQSLIYKFLNPKTKLILWATLSDHTEQNRGVLRNLVRQALLRYADQIWVNGNSGFSYINQFIQNMDKVTVIPYPTDDYFLLPLKIKGNFSTPIKMLTVGNLIPRKGIVEYLILLIKYLKLHTETCVEFVIIGNGPLNDQLVNMPKPYNLKITITGFVDYKDLPEEYAKADYFVFPTLADEWGVVVNEAMASGVPVIGSCYSQAVEEMVVCDETGWIFDPLDTEDSLRTIHKALNIPFEVYQSMQKKCYIRASELSYNLIGKRMVNELTAIFARR